MERVDIEGLASDYLLDLNQEGVYFYSCIIIIYGGIIFIYSYIFIINQKKFNYFFFVLFFSG